MRVYEGCEAEALDYAGGKLFSEWERYTLKRTEEGVQESDMSAWKGRRVGRWKKKKTPLDSDKRQG